MNLAVETRGISLFELWKRESSSGDVMRYEVFYTFYCGMVEHFTGLQRHHRAADKTKEAASGDVTSSSLGPGGGERGVNNKERGADADRNGNGLRQLAIKNTQAYQFLW